MTLAVVATCLFAAGLDKARRTENSLNAIRISSMEYNGGRASKNGPSSYYLSSLGRGMEKGRSPFVWPVDGVRAGRAEESPPSRGAPAVSSSLREQGFIMAGIEPPSVAQATRAAPAPSSSGRRAVLATSRGGGPAVLGVRPDGANPSPTL